MTAKSLMDLQGECCHLSALAAGLEVLEWESWGDDPQATASRGALRPIILNLAARLSDLNEHLARLSDRECIVVPNEPDPSGAQRK